MRGEVLEDAQTGRAAAGIGALPAAGLTLEVSASRVQGVLLAGGSLAPGRILGGDEDGLAGAQVVRVEPGVGLPDPRPLQAVPVSRLRDGEEAFPGAHAVFL